MSVEAIIRHRRDTAANWTSNDPTLEAGQLGYETDTRKWKWGDGATAWTALAYAAADPATAPTYTPPAIVTDATTALTAIPADANQYTRFTNAAAKTYTFTDAETYVVGSEFFGRNVGAGDLTLTEGGGFTLNPPAGGTLVVPEGGSFAVKIVGASEADVTGYTVAA
jgi:hypothetical protein